MTGGWYPRRRGILEHLERGTISLLDSAIHDFLCLTADYRTGVAWASAEKIRALCPERITLKAVQRSLNRLELLGWLKRFRTRGRKGNYPVLVGRYFVRDASLTWKSVSLEKTTDWRDVQFDVVIDPSFTTDTTRTDVSSSVSLTCPEAVTDAASPLSPLKEVREQEARKQEERPKKKEGEETPPPPPQLKKIIKNWQQTIALFQQPDDGSLFDGETFHAFKADCKANGVDWRLVESAWQEVIRPFQKENNASPTV